MMPKAKLIYLIIILGLTLRLALIFAVPPFAGPDEQCHYDYVKYLVDNKSLPVDVYQDSHYEYFQAPLYYLVLAPFYALAGAQPQISRLYLLRLVNLLMATVILWLSYGILKRMFPGAVSLVAGGLAFVAWHPVYARNSVCINNDNLAVLISAMLLYLLISQSRISKPVNKSVTIGLLWGLGILAKTSLLAFAPAILYTAYAEDEQGSFKKKWRKMVASFMVSILMVLLISGFWLIRNQALYGNMMGMGPYWPRPQSPFSLAFQSASFKHTWVSFWRTFDVGSEPGIWKVFKYMWMVVTIGAWVGWGRLLFTKNRRALFDIPPGLLLTVVLFLSFYVAGWLFGVRYGQGFHGFFDGRFLFAVMIPAGALFSCGLELVVPIAMKKYIWTVWSLGLILNAGLLLLGMLKIIR